MKNQEDIIRRKNIEKLESLMPHINIQFENIHS